MIKSKGNIFYVYLHRKETNKEIFYVGKGSGKRYTSVSSRSNFWKNIVKKYGLLIEVVDSNLPEDQAFELEMFLIEFIGCDNLCNLTKGGEGVSGLKHTASSIEKMSNSKRGKVIKENTRLKISDSLKGKRKSNLTIDRIRTSRLDNNYYVFSNKLNKTVICTRQIFSHYLNIDRKCVDHLFKKNASKTVRGWSKSEMLEIVTNVTHP